MNLTYANFLLSCKVILTGSEYQNTDIFGGHLSVYRSPTSASKFSHEIHMKNIFPHSQVLQSLNLLQYHLVLPSSLSAPFISYIQLVREYTKYVCVCSHALELIHLSATSKQLRIKVKTKLISSESSVHTDSLEKHNRVSPGGRLPPPSPSVDFLSDYNRFLNSESGKGASNCP